MSWKGTTKAFGRMPQQVLTKTGIRSETKDRRFEDVSGQFAELTKATEKFHSDVIKFRDSMSNMMNHQANISDLLIELYDYIQGEGSSEGAVTPRRAKTPARSMKAVTKYTEISAEIRDLVLPELDDIDTKIVEPVLEFMKIIKAIRKVVIKHDHKKVDYDRYKLNLKKLQDKKDRSLSDEKQMYKLEEQFDHATQEYEYYNDVLKKELPLFFEYRVEFIEPIVESFYHVQLKIFGILLERFEQLVRIGYFDTETDIVKGFESRREEANQLLDELTIIDRRKREKEKLSAPRGSTRSRSSDPVRSPGLSPSDSSSIRSRSPGYRTSRRDYDEEEKIEEDEDDAPPEYTPVTIPRPKKAPPPPIAPKPKLAHYAIALYDYDAQAEGDLSFRKDDKIEVIERTPDVNDWWKGKLRGKIGMFPGNYVEEL